MAGCSRALAILRDSATGILILSLLATAQVSAAQINSDQGEAAIKRFNKLLDNKPHGDTGEVP
jgi:hypothetical protein